MLENEVLLSLFFINSFTAVMARVVTIYCFSELTLQQGFPSGDKVCLPPDILLDVGHLPRSLLAYIAKLSWNKNWTTRWSLYDIFARVGWPNIGPAAAKPAGPVPMALHNVIPQFSLIAGTVVWRTSQNGRTVKIRGLVLAWKQALFQCSMLLSLKYVLL